MGKKAVKKIKELSVAIAESTSTTTEAQNIITTTPRKRGRPRKIIEKQEEEEEEEEEEKGEKEKKLEEINKEVIEVVGSSITEEVKFEDKDFPRRSRARKKSKPRKSS